MHQASPEVNEVCRWPNDIVCSNRLDQLVLHCTEELCDRYRLPSDSQQRADKPVHLSQTILHRPL